MVFDGMRANGAVMDGFGGMRGEQHGG